MKTTIEPMQQSGGSILQQAPHLQTGTKQSVLTPVKKKEKMPPAKITPNDPANWDTGWFSNYE